MSYHGVRFMLFFTLLAVTWVFLSSLPQWHSSNRKLQWKHFHLASCLWFGPFHRNESYRFEYSPSEKVRMTLNTFSVSLDDFPLSSALLTKKRGCTSSRMASLTSLGHLYIILHSAEGSLYSKLLQRAVWASSLVLDPILSTKCLKLTSYDT